MAFWRRIPGFRPRTEERAIRDNDLWGRWARGEEDQASEFAGVRVNRQTALQLSAVWACVSLISDAIATLPIAPFVRRGRDRLPTSRPSWMDAPNPEQERVDWVGQQLMSLLLDGTAYVLTVRDEDLNVLEAWNIEAGRVTPRRQAGRVVYDVSDPERGLVTLDSTQMFHIPAVSLPGQLKGIPPLETARRMLSTGLAAQQYAERFYGQGLAMAGVIELDGDLDPDDARELKESFARSNSGPGGAHMPGVLTAGAKWKQLSVSPEQAQFLESRSFSVTEIARFFRVPPHMIADVERSTSWGTGIEQQAIGLVTYTLRPWLERLEQRYTRHMLPLPSQSAGAFVKFNVDGLLRGDVAARYTAYGAGRTGGWLSVNDIRAREDMPSIGPDGDEYIVPLNMRGAGDEPPAEGGTNGSAT